MSEAEITALGQVGYKLKIGDSIIYIDPYLSNSVQEKEDSAIVRMVAAPFKPEEITDADFVLITHAHRDHCDEDTLLPLSGASKNAKFIGPDPVCTKLSNMGINKERIICVTVDPIDLTENIKVHIVPAAHPEVRLNDNGEGWQCVGYVIEASGRRIYHAGDTSLREEVIKSIKGVGGIDIGMIPVNEQNFMREKQGIIGNMTVREAFYLGEQIGVKTFIPTHWDMFEKNQVYKQEIELLYKLISPPFELMFKEVLQ